MSDKLKFEEYIVTSVEEQEFIRADFKKAFGIILLSLFSSLTLTYLFFIS